MKILKKVFYYNYLVEQKKVLLMLDEKVVDLKLIFYFVEILVQLNHNYNNISFVWYHVLNIQMVKVQVLLVLQLMLQKILKLVNLFFKRKNKHFIIF